MWNGPYSSLTVQPRLFVNTRQKPCGVSPHFSLLTHSVAYFRAYGACVDHFLCQTDSPHRNLNNKRSPAHHENLRWNPNENPSTTFSLLPLNLLAMALQFGHLPLKIGTDFENRALRFLKDTFSMSLGRIGGPSDGGIDLQGWWWLPPLQGLPVSEDHSVASMPTKVTDLGRSIADVGRRRVRVLAQCKAESKPLGPHYIREMEGVLYGYLVSLSQRSSCRGVDLDADAMGISSSQPSQVYPTIGMVVSQSSIHQI
jgi:hypothetical protein